MIEYNDKESIIHYLYKLSCYKEFFIDSNAIFCNLKKEKGINSEELKKNFELKNNENIESLTNHTSTSSLFPNKDEKINDKIKNIMIKKIKNQLNIDLDKNYEIGYIFNLANNNFLNAKGIFDNSLFVELISDKLKNYIIESINSFYSIIREMEKKFKSNLEKITKEKEKINKDNLSLKELIKANMNEIKSLKLKIEENSKIQEEKIDSLNKKIESLAKKNIELTQDKKKISDEFEKKIKINEKQQELLKENLEKKI